MAYLQALKKNKKTYIVLMSIITVIIALNEGTQFWALMKYTSFIGWLTFCALLVLAINVGIKLKVWEY